MLKEDEEFRYLVAGLIGLEDIKRSIKELITAVAKNAEQIADLRAAIADLKNAVAELRSIVEVHSKEIADLRAAIADLKNAVEARGRRISRLEREVRAIRSILENITISIEEEANEYIKYILGQRGIRLETGPVFFDKKYEFDIYGSDGTITIIGDAKTRVGANTVRRLVERVKRVSSMWPDRFRGRVIIVLYCLRAVPGAVDEAEKHGVWLIESMREKTPLKL